MKNLKMLGLFLGISLLPVLTAASVFGEEKLQVIPPETAQMRELRKAMDAEVDALSARMIEMSDWMNMPSSDRPERI
jgi:hypothetical protein